MRIDYCKDFTTYHRHQTSQVTVGGIQLGGNNPIRIQSMTNTNTNDTRSTVKQIIRIYEKGADYVRLAVPNKKTAENLSNIKAELEKTGIHVPLIADIHFNPEFALIAATIVNKVRINPGNYCCKNKLNAISYNPEQYAEELEKLKSQFIVLLDVCREHNTSLRIGTNHGSLSNRILNRFGDTPEGMAESSMEFLRICKEEKFEDVVVSLKASNTRIMIYATRLLVIKMKEEGMYYPVHLGVTEAGEGEDGRIKSAVGIGSLLSDGIGDTIRISLTEEPEVEIPVARKIIDYIAPRNHHKFIENFGSYPIHPFEYNKRFSESVENIGDKNLPVVIKSIQGVVDLQSLKAIGWEYSEKTGWNFTDLAPDYLHIEKWPFALPVPKEKNSIHTFREHKSDLLSSDGIYVMTIHDFLTNRGSINSLKFVILSASEINDTLIDQVITEKKLILVIESDNANSLADQRAAAFRLINRNCKIPLIFKRNYSETNREDFLLKSSLDLGEKPAIPA